MDRMQVPYEYNTTAKVRLVATQSSKPKRELVMEPVAADRQVDDVISHCLGI